MQLDNEALIRVLKWAWVCDTESRMNSVDYDLAMQIAVQVGNTTMAEEYARYRLQALDSEAVRRAA